MAAIVFPGSYQARRKSAATWTRENYVLLSGEIGLETDTGLFKFGNGSTAWATLPYANAVGSPAPAAAASVPYSTAIPLDTAGAGKVMPETILAASSVFSVGSTPQPDGTCQVVLVGDGSHTPEFSAFTKGNTYTYSSALNARNYFVFSYQFGAAVYAGLLLPPLDAGLPTIASVTVFDSDAGTFRLVWSEAMYSTISAAAAFTVPAHTITAHTRLDSLTTTLTTSTPVTQPETLSLTYTVPASNRMMDSALNEAATQTLSITNSVTNPQLTSAVVSNSTPTRIDMTWSDTISSTIPAAAAFAVSAGHALTAHTYVDSTHTYLTTSTAFVGGEGAKTLAYTVPGSNPIKDLNVIPNLGLGITGRSITNNVVPAVPTTKVFGRNTGNVGDFLIGDMDGNLNNAGDISGSAYFSLYDGASTATSIRAVIQLTGLTAQIGAGKTITAVTFHMPVQNAGGDGSVLSIYHSLRDCVVAQVTDLLAKTGVSWAGQVASGAGDKSAVLASSPANAAFDGGTGSWTIYDIASTASLVATVQAAIDGSVDKVDFIAAVAYISGNFRNFYGGGATTGVRATISITYT